MKKYIAMLAAMLVAGFAMAQIQVEVTNVRAPNTPATVADNITANAGDIIYDTTEKTFQFYDGETVGGWKYQKYTSDRYWCPAESTDPLANGTNLLAAVTAMNIYATPTNTAYLLLQSISLWDPEHRYHLNAPIYVNGNYSLKGDQGGVYAAMTGGGGNDYGNLGPYRSYKAAWIFNQNVTNVCFVMGQEDTIGAGVIENIAFMGAVSNAVDGQYRGMKNVAFYDKWYAAAMPSKSAIINQDAIMMNCYFAETFRMVIPDGTYNYAYFSDSRFEGCYFNGWMAGDADVEYVDCKFGVTARLVPYRFTSPAVNAAYEGSFDNCLFVASDPFEDSWATNSTGATVNMKFENCDFASGSTGWFDNLVGVAAGDNLKFIRCNNVWAGITNWAGGLIIKDCTDTTGAYMADDLVL